MEYYTISDNILKEVIFLYIVAGSITVAARLKKLLESASGYPADVVHTPKAINKTGGCSYSVRASDKLLPIVRPLCSEYNIRIRNIYVERFHNGERVFNAVS